MTGRKCRALGPIDITSNQLRSLHATSMHRSQKQIDRTITDLLTVFNALFNGVAEVKASENPRKRILLRSLGEAVVLAEYGRWIRAFAPGRQRQAACSEANVVGSEE